MHHMKKIGAAVRELRKKADMTLEDLANEAGYDQGNLSKFERGMQTTDDDMIGRLAKGLKTSVSELLRRAAELEAADEKGNYPVTTSATVAYADEPLAQYQEVKKVPVFEGVHLKALAEDQASLSKIPVSKYLPGLADSRVSDFAMLITDDSMTAPPGGTQSYPLGHYAHFDPALEHRSGDSVIVLIGGTNIGFTSVQNVNGIWMMVPLNTRYPARELPFNSRILAVAVGSYAVTRER